MLDQSTHDLDEDLKLNSQPDREHAPFAPLICTTLKILEASTEHPGCAAPDSVRLAMNRIAAVDDASAKTTRISVGDPTVMIAEDSHCISCGWLRLQTGLDSDIVRGNYQSRTLPLDGAKDQ